MRVGGSVTDPPTPAGVWVVSLFSAALVVLPLVFWPPATESFAVPKLAFLGFVLILAAGIRWLERPHRADGRLRLGVMDWLVAVFGGLTLISQVTSIEPGQSLFGEPFQRQGTLAILASVAVYFAVSRLGPGETGITFMCSAIAAGGSLVGAYAVLQAFHWDPFWSLSGTVRVLSSVGQPNSLGAYLVLTVPLTAALALTDRRWSPLWIAGLALQCAALLLTQSRGAYVALLVASGLMMPAVWRTLRSDRKRVFAVSVAGVVFVSVVFVPLRSNVGQAVDRIGAVSDFRSGSVAQHLDLWRIAVAMVADAPVIGSGPSTYAVRFPDYRDRLLPDQRARSFTEYRVESPHNVYLAVAVGSGSFAALVFTSILVVGLSTGLRLARRSQTLNALLYAAVGAALLGYTVSQLFVTSDVTSSFVAWALLGMIDSTRLGNSDWVVGDAPSRHRADDAK